MVKDKISQKPVFDSAKLQSANELLNKQVLIGATYYDYKGKFIEQKQLHGKVTSVETGGFVVSLEGTRTGDTFRLPPDLNSFRKAPPGTYREHSTGEVIINPDYLVMWAINKPPPAQKEADE
jgi:hypothetical protein